MGVFGQRSAPPRGARGGALTLSRRFTADRCRVESISGLSFQRRALARVSVNVLRIVYRFFLIAG
jgi:hypothetical protein